MAAQLGSVIGLDVPSKMGNLDSRVIIFFFLLVSSGWGGSLGGG